MWLIDWFRNTTLEGPIKRNLSSFDASSGRGKLEVQELDKKFDGQRTFRFNIQRTTIGSYQSLPIVLTESQVEELHQSLLSALNNK